MLILTQLIQTLLIQTMLILTQMVQLQLIQTQMVQTQLIQLTTKVMTTKVMTIKINHKDHPPEISSTNATETVTWCSLWEKVWNASKLPGKKITRDGNNLPDGSRRMRDNLMQMETNFSMKANFKLLWIFSSRSRNRKSKRSKKSAMLLRALSKTVTLMVTKS